MPSEDASEPEPTGAQDPLPRPDDTPDHTMGSADPPRHDRPDGPGHDTPPPPGLLPPAAPDLRSRTEPDGAVPPPPDSPPPDIDGFRVDPPETTPHRLPLRSLVGGVSPRALWGALPAFFVLRDTGVGFLGIIVGIFVVTQVARFVMWTRFRWGFDGHVVRISSGLLWRRVRALDVERIQQVEIQQPLLHQVMGTAVVTVETASEGGESEVRLDGLDNETATALQAAILTARRRERAEADGSLAEGAGAGPGSLGAPRPASDGAAAPDGSGAEPTTSILKPSVADLVRHALTGSSLLVVPLSIAALGEFAFDLFGDDIDQVATQAARASARLGYLTIAVIAAVVGAVGAIVTTLLRDWDIELVLRGDDLRLTRGLLTRHATTIPLHRMQVVQYRQNWLRRALGVGTVVVRSAGGAAPTSPNEGGSATMSVPWVADATMPDVLATILDRSLGSPADLPLAAERHPPAARRRLAWKWARGLLLLVAVIGVGLVVVGIDDPATRASLTAAGLVLVVAGTWLLSGAQYRRLGHATTSRVALVTGGVLGSARDWMPLARLQGVQGAATIFQRRLDLASVRLTPAGGGNAPVVITDVATDTADDLGHRFVLVAAGTPGTSGTSWSSPAAGPRSAAGSSPASTAPTADHGRPEPPGPRAGRLPTLDDLPSGPPPMPRDHHDPEHPDGP